MGVKSIPHIHNPVCWAIIPENEIKEICEGKYQAVQAAAFMLMKKIKICSDPGCPACCTISDLMKLERHCEQDFIKSPEYSQNKLEVISTLSDRSLGWCVYTQGFSFDHNTCNNNRLGFQQQITSKPSITSRENI